MEKLLAMHIAGQLTQAACSGIGGNLPISPDLSDNAVRAKNLQVWETFNVFYRGIAAELQAGKLPTPSIPAGPLVSGLGGAILELVQKGPLADLLKGLIASVPKLPEVTTPLPNPGEQPATPTRS